MKKGEGMNLKGDSDLYQLGVMGGVMALMEFNVTI